MAKPAPKRPADDPLGPPLRLAAYGDGPPGGPGAPEARAVSNGRLAVAMLIAAETMLFAGLIGAYLVFRLSAPVWPPPFQPRLPLGVTGVNTLVLLVSGLALRKGVAALRAGRATRGVRRVWLAIGLGALFLAAQGYEWTRLIHFGLTVTSGVYGGTFYTLIGCHALHVAAALGWLAGAAMRARRAPAAARHRERIELAGMYWIFVVALWPALYALVYLS